MKSNAKNSGQHEQLLLTMRGPPSENGAVPVGLFVAAYGTLARLMSKSAERLAGKGKGAELEFVVAELSRGVPFQAGIEAAPSLRDGDLARKTVIRTEKLLRAVNAGKGDDIPAAELGLIEKMAGLFSEERVSMMQVQRFNGRACPPVKMTPRLAANVDRLRGRELGYPTSVIGRVERVNLHGVVSLEMRPDIGEPVHCVVRDSSEPDAAREKAMRAVGKRASISGDALCRPIPGRPDVHYPYKMFADPGGIEIFDFGGKQGSILEFQGAFPNITGGKPTLEYLRELRGEDD